MSSDTTRNPFSTRYVCPGAVPYFFHAGKSTDALLLTLQENGWWGEITGDHGTGKSSLLADLIPAMREEGRGVVHVSLHDGESRIPATDPSRSEWSPSTQIIVDGYEQLSWWSRTGLAKQCRRTGCGLLVTAHQSVGLPSLAHLTPTLGDVLAVVEHLVPDSQDRPSRAEVADRFAANDGNVRETLFDLYDLHERRLA